MEKGTVEWDRKEMEEMGNWGGNRRELGK